MTDKIYLINLLRRYIVMDFEQFKEEAQSRIQKRNSNLESYFNAGDYYKMAAEFPDNARLLTHDGEVIPGKASENYWRRVKDTLNGTDLKFENKFFEAMELILPSGHTDNDFDFVAIEVSKFSFKASGNEYKGYIDPPYRHRVRCDWH
jgi:hypothetical protein